MKLRIYHLFILLAALFVTAACENELPLNVKDSSPKLVMNALMNADSLTHTVYLNLTGKKQATHISEATLEIRVNGELTARLRPAEPLNEKDTQCRFVFSRQFVPGDAVRIDAITDDNLYHARAEVTVPQRPRAILGVDTLTVQMRYNDTDRFMRYRIHIEDRPGETNYYRLIMKLQTVDSQYNQLTGKWDDQISRSFRFISREDVVLTDGHPTSEDDEENGIFETVKNTYGVFNDSRFQDASYTMTVYNQPKKLMNGWNNEYVRQKITNEICLLSLTETEYYYLKALNTFESDAYDETINEPIKFPSNVTGGVGVVGISSGVSYTVPIKE